MKIQEVWFDGICNKCGDNVYETQGRDEDIEEAKFADYKNACSNEKCKENYWHYVGDMEELDYYIHKRG